MRSKRALPAPLSRHAPRAERLLMPVPLADSVERGLQAGSDLDFDPAAFCGIHLTVPEPDLIPQCPSSDPRPARTLQT